MAKGSINWMAGGPQGSGVDTAANIFGRACGYGGLYVFGRREYHSNIKGLHSYFHLRVSKQETQANVNEVVPNGGIIVDALELRAKVLDIPTLPPEYKDELRKFKKEQNLGETLND